MEMISLMEAYHDDIKREQSKLIRLNDPSETEYSLSSLSYINITYFLYTAFEERDIQRSKNYLYKAAMCKSFYFGMSKLDVYGALNTFTFPVLSDSSEAIERYLKYPLPEMEYAKDSFNTRFAQAIQAVLRGEDILLEEHIEILKKRSKRGWQKLYAGVVPAFEGLLSKNKELIEQGVYELLKTNKKQHVNEIDYQYINYEAATIAKLAYRTGIEVEIDSPLVPKELLPVKELDKYEGYDFFKELELI